MPRTPARATITVAPASAVQAPQLRRTAAPTAKARELKSARRTRQTTRGIRPGLSRPQAIEESDDNYEEEGGHDDDANTLEQLLELVKDLKVITEEQNQVKPRRKVSDSALFHVD